MESVRPDIFKYSEYRKFLADFFDYKKSLKPTFSFQTVATKIHTSRGYFKNVIDERRHISTDKISAIGSLFSLEKLEVDYLLMMVLKESAGDAALISRFSDILSSLRGQRTAVTSKAEGIFDDKNAFVFQDWLSATIHAMSDFPDFQFSADWVKSRLIDGDAVSEEQIQTILERLLENGLIKEENGKYKLGMSVQNLGNPLTPRESMKLMQPLVAKCFDVLEDGPKYRPARCFGGHFIISQSDIVDINEAFADFHKKVIAISEGARKPNEPTSIIQMTSLFCALTKQEEK